MKKVFLWLIIVSMIAVFSLAGCRGQSAEEAVVAAETAIVDLSTQALVDTATGLYTKANGLVGAYSEGTVKDDLTARLAVVQDAIEKAQVLLEEAVATEAVIAAEVAEEVTEEGDSSTSSNGTGGAEGYQYWKGDIPNSSYFLNIYGERALKVTGKPFMVLTYDRISLEITDCQIGLSEVTQEAIPNPSNFPEAPYPTLDANMIYFHEKLDLKSPVALLVSWNVNLPGGVSKSPITNGVQNFSFRSGYCVGGVGYTEEWRFNYTSDLMTGDVKNLDTTDYMGGESETNAFKLIKK